MKKTSASVILALILDIIFGLLFMFMIVSIKKEDEITYYMNQIGIFNKQDNVDKCIDEIESFGLKGYTYMNDDLIIVVASITLIKEECLKEQIILEENNIDFILKEINTTNENLIIALKDNDFEKVMELMTK